VVPFGVLSNTKKRSLVILYGIVNGFLGSTRVGIILWPWPLGDACYQGIPYVPGKKKKKKATKVPR
jgi:hypothetical protein